MKVKTIEFSHNNKTFKFQPFRRKGYASRGSSNNNLITLSKSGYNLSGGWCQSNEIDSRKLNYIIFGKDMEHESVIHFAIAEGEEGKKSLEEYFGEVPNKSASRKGASKGGLWGGLGSAYKGYLKDILAKIIEEGHQRYIVHKSPNTDPKGLIKGFYFDLSEQDEKPSEPWLSISPSELEKDTSFKYKYGTYRYFDVDGNIIYIGQGSIRDRFKSTNEDRASWGISRVEYVEIEIESERRAFEKKVVAKFEEEHGFLPKYNIIRGG